MTSDYIEITASTTVHELLVVYPELEETLISIAAPFRKLKNPLLRKSIAKIATLKHISAVGNIPLNDLVNEIRMAVGQSETSESYEDEKYYLDQPEWFSIDKIALSVNEEELEVKDKMTVVVILQEAKQIKKGEIIELTTTFLPAPGIETMRSKGYSVWTKKEDENLIKTYFLKND
jgi:hypothetical protein